MTEVGERTWVAVEHARAQVALRESEQRLRSVLDGMGEAFGLMNYEFRILMQNSEALRLDGRPPEEIVGRTHWEAYPGSEDSEIGQLYKRAMAEKAPVSLEHRYDWPDGHSATWLDMRAFPVPEGLAVFWRDITERKEAEVRMAQQAEELLRTNRELEQYASIASHDLQEPLRKITSFGELLVRDYSDRLDERGRLLVDRMVDGAQRLRQLIQDLLSYSRSSNDRMRFADVPLADLLAEASNDFELAIAEAGAIITCESDIVLRGDELLLRQMFRNLLGNSLKYRGDVPPHVRVAAAKTEDELQWHLTIRDNGIGFASRHAERVFEMFKRLHPRDAYPGTGIGLALCQRIVERHGGRIWVESELGAGSCFHIELPIAPVEARDTAIPDPEDGRGQ